MSRPSRFSRPWILTAALAVGVVIAALSVPLSAQAAGTGSITGKVMTVDAPTVGLANASVFLQLPGGTYVADVQTGSDGTYTFTGLAAADYVVLASPQAPSTYASAFSATISLSAGQSVTGTNVTLPVGGQISGVITGAGAAPVSGASISANGSSGSDSAQSAADGSYHVTGLPAGSYTVTVNAPFGNSQYLNAPATTVTVTLGSTTTLSKQLTLGGSISGVVTGGASSTALPFATVQALTSSGDPVTSTGAAADGSYTLSGLAAGNYTLEFAASYMSTVSYAPQWWSGAASQAAAQPIAVTAGAALTGYNANLAAGASISGTVTGPNGAALANTQVEVLVPGQVLGTYFPTDSSGHYSALGLAAGDYIVAFDGQGAAGNEAPQWWSNSSTLAGATVVHLGTTQALTGINAQLSAGGTISGTISGVVASGTIFPAGNANLEIYAADGSRAGVAMADLNGAYQVTNLAPGTYTMHVDPQPETTDFPSQWYLNASTQGAATPITVTAGTTTTASMTLGQTATAPPLPLPSGPPRGSLDFASAGLGNITVAGWALDPDTSDPIAVALYVDGKYQAQTQADQTRSDIASAFPGYGSSHGYSVTLVSIPAGTHTVCAYGINAGPSASNTTLGCRTVSVMAANPVGSLESVASTGPGSVSVSGWALDADATAPLAVHVYVDGAFNSVLSATGSRPDVGAAYPGTGNTHGYSTTLTGLASGAHTVCTYGINQGSGTNVLLGCRSITVLGGNPFGSFDAATVTSFGTVTVGGWALDPDTASSISVQAYVDGVFNSQLTADGSRPDIAGAFAGYGATHGFSAPLTGLAGGTHTICVYGINQLAGSNSTLGCRTVSLPTGLPFGSLDSVTAAAGSVAVNGWTIDPDSAASVAVHVYVDGIFDGAYTAHTVRADVGAAYPGYGTTHGFAISAPTTVGTHSVCAYAINIGPGSGNPSLGCRTVTVTTPAP